MKSQIFRIRNDIQVRVPISIVDCNEIARDRERERERVEHIFPFGKINVDE